MKYMEAAASLSREDRLKYASEGTTYDTVVSMTDLLLCLTKKATNAFIDNICHFGIFCRVL